MQDSPDFPSRVKGALLGLAVGDALGVPVEFLDRNSLRFAPVFSMRGHGTHDQPAGTWSDDTSLACCLAESLAETGLNFADQARRMVAWVQDGLWTPHGEVFDIGGTTYHALSRLAAGCEPITAGPAEEGDCGNGSLMRIAPLGLYLANAAATERADDVMTASRLTHGHPRCQLSCASYCETLAALAHGATTPDAVEPGLALLERLVRDRFPEESKPMEKLLAGRLDERPEAEIRSGGYVVDTLTASLWCLLRASSFEEGVLAAVNLGGDTDTTGAVAGALLGARFGIEAIPQSWLEELARVDDLWSLLNKFIDAVPKTAEG